MRNKNSENLATIGEQFSEVYFNMQTGLSDVTDVLYIPDKLPLIRNARIMISVGEIFGKNIILTSGCVEALFSVETETMKCLSTKIEKNGKSVKKNGTFFCKYRNTSYLF